MFRSIWCDCFFSFVSCDAMPCFSLIVLHTKLTLSVQRKPLNWKCQHLKIKTRNDLIENAIYIYSIISVIFFHVCQILLLLQQKRKFLLWNENVFAQIREQEKSYTFSSNIVCWVSYDEWIGMMRMERMKSIFCRCDCSFVYWLVCSFVRTIAFKKFTLCLCLNCIPFWLDLISFWFYSLSFERFLLMFYEFVFIYWWFSLSTEWEFEKVNLLTEGQTTALKQQQMMDLCKASESMRSGKVFQ